MQHSTHTTPRARWRPAAAAALGVTVALSSAGSAQAASFDEVRDTILAFFPWWGENSGQLVHTEDTCGGITTGLSSSCAQQLATSAATVHAKRLLALAPNCSPHQVPAELLIPQKTAAGNSGAACDVVQEVVLPAHSFDHSGQGTTHRVVRSYQGRTVVLEVWAPEGKSAAVDTLTCRDLIAQDVLDRTLGSAGSGTTHAGSATGDTAETSNGQSPAKDDVAPSATSAPTPSGTTHEQDHNAGAGQPTAEITGPGKNNGGQPGSSTPNTPADNGYPTSPETGSSGKDSSQTSSPHKDGSGKGTDDKQHTPGKKGYPWGTATPSSPVGQPTTATATPSPTSTSSPTPTTTSTSSPRATSTTPVTATPTTTSRSSPRATSPTSVPSGTATTGGSHGSGGDNAGGNQGTGTPVRQPVAYPTTSPSIPPGGTGDGVAGVDATATSPVGSNQSPSVPATTNPGHSESAGTATTSSGGGSDHGNGTVNQGGLARTGSELLPLGFLGSALLAGGLALRARLRRAVRQEESLN